jgi:hypothetical protein
MSSKLRKHTTRSLDNDDEYEDDESIEEDVPVVTDPRWDGLKVLLENDNN